jgi:hypothetical protein
MGVAMPSQMISLKELKKRTLRWTQPKALVRHHELRSDQNLLATLTWPKPLRSLAEAVTADGRYTLKRGGFLRPFVSIRDVAFDNEIAALKIGLLGHGTLEFANGRRITVLSTRFWSYDWELIDEGGQLLCKVKKITKVMTNSADVTVSEGIRKDRDLMVMMIASWYAMVLMSDEAAAATVPLAVNPALMTSH